MTSALVSSFPECAIRSPIRPPTRPPIHQGVGGAGLCVVPRVILVSDSTELRTLSRRQEDPGMSHRTRGRSDGFQ